MLVLGELVSSVLQVHSKDASSQERPPKHLRLSFRTKQRNMDRQDMQDIFQSLIHSLVSASNSPFQRINDDLLVDFSKLQVG